MKGSEGQLSIDEQDETTSASLGEQPFSERLVLLLLSTARLASFPLPPSGSVTIGRSREVEVSLDDASVSRLHARITIEPGPSGGPVLTLEDLGSLNGTTVNGARIESRAKVVICPGQAIKLGFESLLTIHSGSGAELEELSLPEREASSEDRRGRGATEGKGAKSAKTAKSGVVFEAPAMKALHQLVERIAPSEINVLILGETGVGKEVVARLLHECSRRAHGPFMPINCGAIAPTLLESELFGYIKGAFTGADATKAGLFEAAERGTVFLDEVGEMPLDMQVKLLRVLEERCVWRLGSREALPVDVRIVAATHQDLGARVEAGAFRRDLYYRLNGLTLEIPPLRKRPEEIEPLARKFLADAAMSSGHGGPCSISREAIEQLTTAEWPGNIRQLKNTIECAHVLAGGAEIRPEHLPPLERPARPRRGPMAETVEMPVPDALTQRWDVERPSKPPSVVKRDAPLSDEISELERRRILEALDLCGGNQTRAAEMLGMSRKTLLARLDAHGIQRPRKGRVKSARPSET